MIHWVGTNVYSKTASKGNIEWLKCEQKKAGVSPTLPCSLTIECRLDWNSTTLDNTGLSYTLPSKWKQPFYLLLEKSTYKSHRCKMKGFPPKVTFSTKSHGFKNITTPATNAAAITMTTTQTQIEALASFLSSIFITSFISIQMPREGNPVFLCECEERELRCSVTLQSLHKLPSIEALGRINDWGQLKAIY